MSNFELETSGNSPNVIYLVYLPLDLLTNTKLHIILLPTKYIWGSYSPESLHKLVLPENVTISNFYEVEMYKKCPKLVNLVILTNFLALCAL